MTENEIFLQAKVVFLAGQMSQAIDALCDAQGNIAVLRDKLEKTEAELQSLKPKES